nr:hypothetical protein [uncultured Sphingomonas sp.]
MSFRGQNDGPGAAIVQDLQRFMPDGMTLNSWAVAAGVNRTVWGDIRRHGNPSRKTLEKLLDAAGSSLAEFEALRVGFLAEDRVGAVDQVADRRRPWGSVSASTMPILDARPVDPVLLGSARIPAFVLSPHRSARLAVPPTLSNDRGCFAFQMPVGNMWPRYRQGRTLIVAPFRHSVIGDDVLLALPPQGGALERARFVAELIWQDDEAIRLRIYSPGCEFTVAQSMIDAVEKVIGEAI